jgi:hypothetical protein
MDKQVSLNYHYNGEDDILSVWYRQPDEVVCIEPREGILLRIDAQTDEFVGYTILYLHRQFEGQRPEEITLPLVPLEALAPLRQLLRRTSSVVPDRREEEVIA